MAEGAGAVGGGTVGAEPGVELGMVGVLGNSFLKNCSRLLWSCNNKTEAVTTLLPCNIWGRKIKRQGTASTI